MKEFEAFQQGIDSISGGNDRRFKKRIEFEVIILGLQLEQIISANRAKLRGQIDSSHPSQFPKIEVRFIKGLGEIPYQTGHLADLVRFRSNSSRND